MITSTSNIQVKELLRLQKKSREREKEGVFIVEGPRMAEEIPREGVYGGRYFRGDSACARS